MVVAALFSPGAGGHPAFFEAGEAFSRAFASCGTLTCPGTLGASFLPGATALDLDPLLPYVELIREASRALARRRPDLFVCVGGDGLASYVADALIAQRAEDAGAGEIPILGVGAGTANVGPIVSMAVSELEGLDIGSLETFRAGAVEARAGGSHLAYGFNDVVIGSTFLGTIGGAARCLSAEAMAAEGRAVVAEPDPAIAGEDFRIEKNGRIAAGGSPRPAQIVASPLAEGEFYGRAAAGALCEAGCKPALAALSLLGAALIRPDSAEIPYRDFLRVDQLLFESGDRITLHGLTPAAQVVADGNPFLRRGLPVELGYLPGLVAVARVRRSRGHGPRAVR